MTLAKIVLAKAYSARVIGVHLCRTILTLQYHVERKVPVAHIDANDVTSTERHTWKHHYASARVCIFHKQPMSFAKLIDVLVY